MRCRILSAGTGWHTERLEAAFAALGHEARTVPVEALASRAGVTPRVSAGGVSLEDADAVLVRIVPRGSLEQIVFRMDALHRLESLGVAVVNSPRALERAVDKSWATALLADAGIPTPRTVVAETFDDAMAAFDLFGDCVLKPLFGSNGNGLVRISDRDLAHRAFRTLAFERAVFYVQEMVPHPGFDVRAFVAGGRVVAAMTRRSADWRTNLARGGRAERRLLSAEEEELSLRAAAALGLDYGGVDLMPSPGGPLYVLEVNGSPGWEGLQATSDADVAAAIADVVVARARRADRPPRRHRRRRGPGRGRPSGARRRVGFDAAVARAAAVACELEAAAEKPGNVTPRRASRELSHAHFAASARAVGPVLGAAGGRRLGETVLAAIEATRGVAPSNTNLGIVLLLAPLARAAAEGALSAPGSRGARRDALRAAARRVLQQSDVEDARLAYRAIRLARPGGMGRAPGQDLSGTPTVTLLEAMRLAADRDAVAAELAWGYPVTFDRSEPALADALSAGLSPLDAVVETHLRILAHVPDTLIARKFGPDAALETSRRAGTALAAGERRSASRERAIEELDAWLRDPARGWNPGTTADLVACALFVHALTAGADGVARLEAAVATATVAGSRGPGSPGAGDASEIHVVRESSLDARELGGEPGGHARGAL